MGWVRPPLPSERIRESDPELYRAMVRQDAEALRAYLSRAYLSRPWWERWFGVGRKR